MLLLEVVSVHRTSMGRNARRCIREEEATEFTIGRREGSSWVLPQDYVSRLQAVIRCVNGMYFLESKGNAPLAINDRSRPVERNRIVRLSPGDHILIDDIDILTSEVESEEAPVEEPQSAGQAHGVVEAFEVGPGAAGGDVMDLLGGGQGPVDELAETRRVRVLFPEDHSVLDNPMDFSTPAPPAGGAGAGGSADDRWWEEGLRSSPPPRPGRPAQRPEPVRPSPGKPAAPERPAPARAAAAGEVTLDEVLRGAGLDPSQVSMSPEVARQLGEVLRLVVAGTMDVLKARNDIRRELRIPSTMLAPRENNPLKFSADVDDALHKLLVQRASAYLDTVAAFREAFSDIRAHQVALLKSVGIAFDHMLAQFAPQTLDQQLGTRTGRYPLLGMGAKGRPWEAYVAHYADLLTDRDHTYRRLFGEEWAKAYEKELEQQKRRDPGGKAGT